MMPPSGVLKAAAMPAPLPATMRSRLEAMRRRLRPASRCMTEAPICTDGPSRPIEAPDSSPPRVRKTLAIAMRNDSSCRRTRPSSDIDAAIACGMPLPSVAGKRRREIHASAAKPAGAISRLSQGRSRTTPAWALIASSAPIANAIAIRPASSAAPTSSRRTCQRCHDNQGRA